MSLSDFSLDEVEYLGPFEAQRIETAALGEAFQDLLVCLPGIDGTHEVREGVEFADFVTDLEDAVYGGITHILDPGETETYLVFYDGKCLGSSC